MSGLFIKLDVEYTDDPKILRAGPHAELVFIRALALAKRLLSDGNIDTAHLPRLTLGIPGRPAVHAAALVREGLWTVTDTGWHITAWEKRGNMTAAEVGELVARKREAGAKGNHQRHHVANGRTDPTCRYCLAEASQDASENGRTSLANASQTPRQSQSQSQSQSQREEPSSDIGSGIAPVDNPTTVDNVIDAIVDHLAKTNRPRNPAAWRRRVRLEQHAAHADAAARLIEQFPGAPITTLAARLIGEPAPNLANYRKATP